jgi:hypothetical protein
MFSTEAANTNFIVFGLARQWLEPMANHTQGEHTYHYTNNVVQTVAGTHGEPHSR